MKKVFVTYILICVTCLSACSFEIKRPGADTEYEYEYKTTAVNVTEEISATQTEPENITGIVTETQPVLPDTTVQQTTTESQEETTENQEVPETTTKSSGVSFSEVDLSISMPEKNGTMVTDKSSSNKFISIVHKERKIGSDYLVAVYSVPESGQNYVFEFKDTVSRKADDIRRVYLIDADGRITGVAASDSSEKEKISAVENWFCMNVLIKEVIFPAIEKDMQ